MVSSREPGDIVEGIVVGQHDDGLLVDIGGRSGAILPLGEIPRTEILGPGATVLAHVLRVKSSPGDEQEERVGEEINALFKLARETGDYRAEQFM